MNTDTISGPNLVSR